MKKKSCFALLVCLVFAVSLLSGLIACNEHTHKWLAWEDSPAATCTQEGLRIRKCSDTDCRQVQKEAVPAKGHDMGAWSTDKAATCTDTATETRSCKREDCGHTEVQEAEGSDALGHSFTEYTLDTPATCETPGTEIAHCTHTGCTETRYRETAAYGHDYQPTETVVNPAACTTDEEREFKCSLCGKTRNGLVADTALGHGFYHTVSADGETHIQRCENCDYSVSALDHIYSASSPNTCIHCGFTFSEGLTFVFSPDLDGFTVSHDGDTAVSGKLTVPARYTSVGDTVSYPVAAVGKNGFKSKTSITEIEFLGCSLLKIASGAFDSCTSLQKINLPSSLTLISDSAFQNCKSLTEITLPPSLEQIDIMAFRDCESLATINIEGKKIIELLRFGAKVEIVGAFVGCDAIENIFVPDNGILEAYGNPDGYTKAGNWSELYAKFSVKPEAPAEP